MAGIEIHSCPRCELRFKTMAEVLDHLELDHQVVAPDEPAEMVELAGTVIVPVDPAREPTTAVAVAGAVARQGGFGVDIVAVPPPGLAPVATEAYLGVRCREASTAGARQVSCRTLPAGHPSKVIADALSDSEPTLVCMASHSRGPTAELVLGSISEDVVRRSPVPVLLVGPHVKAPADGYRRLLVGLDGSELAERALAVAVGLGSLLGTELYLVEVLGSTHPPSTSDLYESAYLARLVERLPAGAAYDTLHGHDPARAIIDAADDQEGTLVVLGTHGRTGLDRAVMGSVALDVVRRCASPVLVVPATAGASPTASGSTGAGGAAG